ncbi:MAG: hypothetical protein OXH50_02755 [Gemmatimonadetes bacterium]|nr:hypothetical protein [Gemmatimonadota bacterium]
MKESRIHPLCAAAVVLCAGISGCSSEAPTEGTHDSGVLTASGDEHDREGGGDNGGDNGGEAGEELGTALSLDETYDAVRKGVRLVMSYDAEDNSFNGVVRNTTGETLQEVRVEVHLSNGRELGPTTPVDLDPAMEREVRLEATGRDFDAWTPHAEVGAGEHGGSGEDGEHD